MAKPSLLMNMTGEAFQPVRLHYQVLSRSKLVQAFRKLRCLDYDAELRRWVWLYAHEAKRLALPIPHARLEPELHPIVIGAFFLRPEELVLDLRSTERALLALPFFDRLLPRRLVRATDAEIVNRVFPGEEADRPRTPGDFFDRPGSVATDPAAFLAKLDELKSAEDDPEAPSRALAMIEGSARKPLPEVERFPTHYHEDGIGSLQLAFRLRKIVAMRHWSGDADYTLDDAITDIIRLGPWDDDWEDDFEDEDDPEDEDDAGESP